MSTVPPYHLAERMNVVDRVNGWSAGIRHDTCGGWVATSLQSKADIVNQLCECKVSTVRTTLVMVTK